METLLGSALLLQDEANMLLASALEKTKEANMQHLDEKLVVKHEQLLVCLEQATVDIEEEKLNELPIPADLLYFRTFDKISDMDCFKPEKKLIDLRLRFIKYCRNNNVAELEMMSSEFDVEFDDYQRKSIMLQCDNSTIEVFNFLTKNLNWKFMDEEPIKQLCRKYNCDKLIELILSDNSNVRLVLVHLNNYRFNKQYFPTENVKIMENAGIPFYD